MEKESELLKQRREKYLSLKAGVSNFFPNDFEITHGISDIKDAVASYDKESLGDKDSLDDVPIKSAGRIMAINRFGKACFIRFKDYSGQLQAYVRKDKIGDENYSFFKQLDIGDIIGLTGVMFKTKTGEWTLLAESFCLLCKSLRPLPEKYHKLKDPEKRYRKRYLDLIMNPEVKDIFVKRSQVIQSLRAFLLDRNYLEVETPMMQPIPGGAEAAPFITHHNALNMELYLRIAPELYLKRLVVGGFERVFEINRNFRNEGISTQHNPEFTMVEFYQAYATYHTLIKLTQDMFRTIAQSVCGTQKIVYQGNEIDFEKDWQSLTLMESLEKIGGIPMDVLENQNKLVQCATEKGISLAGIKRPGKVITKLFDVLVEPKLIQPTFITGYPVEVSPLSRKNDSNPNITDRFELFIAGREIANGFSELNDPIDQRERFLQQVSDREAGDQEAHFMDEDYVEALEYGLPPTAGEGIGIDRLVMLLTDSPSIREVILFPHMKPSA